VKAGILPCGLFESTDAGPIEKLATELGLRARVFDVDDPPSAIAALADMAVVANCAGPFATTSAPMIDACLNNQTHYLDITGEIDVFLAASCSWNLL
jgi:short subunit dehydrogenase-like uncharacterized protein